MAAKNTSNIVVDALGVFNKGMDSGNDAFSLPADQLAFAVNATVRGNFVRNRPRFQVQSILDSVWDTIKSTGIFQGATYLAPDSGQQQLIAQIGGRLFTFTPDVNDDTVVVKEVTIPGDPNPSGLPQAWLQQAERWVIINNGLNDPIFYDSGTQTSRRSLTTSVVQAISNLASQPFTPAINGTMVMGLTAPYTGPMNQAIQVVEYDNNDVVSETTNYVVVAAGGTYTTYNVTLTNLGDQPGATQGDGSTVSIAPTIIGNIISSGGPYTGFKQVQLSWPAPAQVLVGDLLSIDGYAGWKITDISVPRLIVNVVPVDGLTTHTLNIGSPVYSIRNPQPSVQVGILNSSFIAPAIGATVPTEFQGAYTSPISQIVVINNKQYQVMAYNPTVVPGSNSVTLQNLNDDRSTHQFNAAGTTYPTQIFNFPELPAGRMMSYTRNRVWESLTDAISFIAGDACGDSSGSPAYNFRDAVLKSSENALLAAGGAFRVPSNLGQITAMRTMAQGDAALGQGPLMVVCPGGVFSCDAPADRTLWAALTNPIVSETLIGFGGLSQNSTIVVNGDLFFRAVDGIRSLRMAQRQFDASWGNTPVSFEMERVISQDNVAGLTYASAAQFDNRVLMTCAPVQGPQGVYAAGLIALNLDPISTIQGKAAAVYDGLWTGINTMQLIVGQFNGVQRCFAFTYNATLATLELYELYKTRQGELDNGTNPITWSFETPMILKSVKGKGLYDLCSLEDGEFYVKDVVPGSVVNFKVEYRPDFSACWFPWHEFSLCNDPASTQPVYGPRLGLGKPQSGTGTGASSASSNFGYWFQQRYTIVGHCIFMGEKISASIQPQGEYATPISTRPATPIQCP